MPSRTISLRLPEEIAIELAARTQANGGNESQIILEALSKAWGLSTPISGLSTIKDFQHQLQTIKTYLEAMSEYQTTLQITHNLALHALDTGDISSERPLVPD